MKRKVGKRAQVEMIGLVIIVVLLTLAMLFIAIFALKDSTERKVFTQKGIATSTMAALMKTTIQDATCDEPWLSLEKELLDNCGQNFGLGPGGDWVDCNKNGVKINSCQYLNLTIEKLLSETLGKWNHRYEFVSEIVDSGDIIVGPIKSRGGCSGFARDTDTSGPFYLSAGGFRLVKSELFICN